MQGPSFNDAIDAQFDRIFSRAEEGQRIADENKAALDAAFDKLEEVLSRASLKVRVVELEAAASRARIHARARAALNGIDPDIAADAAAQYVEEGVQMEVAITRAAGPHRRSA